MKKSKEIITRRIVDKTILLPMKTSPDGGLWAFELNETAAWIWENIGDEVSEETLLSNLTENFSIDPAAALADIQEFITEMRSVGALI